MRPVPLLAAGVIVAAWSMLRELPTTDAASTAEATPPVVAAPHIGPDLGPGVVRSIALDGERLPLARLRAVLATQPGGPLRADQLERDRAAMVRALVELGYLAARVEPAIVTRDAAGAAYLSFEVSQGPMFYLRRVEVTGPGQDAAVLTLGAGEPAVRDRIDDARRALVDALGRRGKPGAVELSVHTDLAAAAVDVTFTTR